MLFAGEKGPAKGRNLQKLMHGRVPMNSVGVPFCLVSEGIWAHHSAESAEAIPTSVYGVPPQYDNRKKVIRKRRGTLFLRTNLSQEILVPGCWGFLWNRDGCA